MEQPTQSPQVMALIKRLAETEAAYRKVRSDVEQLREIVSTISHSLMNPMMREVHDQNLCAADNLDLEGEFQLALNEALREAKVPCEKCHSVGWIRVWSLDAPDDWSPCGCHWTGDRPPRY